MHKNWHISEYISSSLYPNKELSICRLSVKIPFANVGGTQTVSSPTGLVYRLHVLLTCMRGSSIKILYFDFVGNLQIVFETPMVVAPLAVIMEDSKHDYCDNANSQLFIIGKHACLIVFDILLDFWLNIRPILFEFWVYFIQ